MHTISRCLLTALLCSGTQLPAQNMPVTTVEGESWLSHLSRPFNETSMGKTGRLGPSPSLFAKEGPQARISTKVLSPTQNVTLHGSDLYRLNCQGCHGESGAGAPPEINSVMNPVRATSAALVMARMKNVGMDMSPSSAAQLAQEARAALQLRLHKGGESMPPFPHLDEAEVRALLAYLKQLAGFPGAEHEQAAVQESRLRVGEHIVKSTCHTCHGAAGSNPNAQQLLDGAIPPLSTLTSRTTLPELVRKVTQGAPIMMGDPAILCRGRMPVFGYLTEEEAADVYLYLENYPPSQAGVANLAASSAAPGSFTDLPPRGPGKTLPRTEHRKITAVFLLKFASFPTVLFLFLGGALITGLPRVIDPRAGTKSRVGLPGRGRAVALPAGRRLREVRERSRPLEELHEHSKV